MKPITDIKKQLTALVPESIADVIRELKALLPDQSGKYRDVLALEGRLNDTNKNRLFGVISDDQLQLEYNRLRKDLFDLIDSLTEADFSPEDAQPIPKKGRQGSVLYRIPHTMPLGKESKCIVRIALDKETIIQNIDLDEHVQLKDIRVSDIMLVELLDPSPEQPFRIRTLNTPEQFIEPGENTDWIFYVTPTRPGIFPLALKVSVIELMQGKERRREIVLEEKVEIVSEGLVEDVDERLQAAEYALSFAAEKAPSRAVTPPIQYPFQPFVGPARPTMTRKVPKRSGSVRRRMSFLLVALLTLTSLSWAVAPVRVEWLAVRYLMNNERAYNWFIERRKESPLRENAFIRKAKTRETKEEAVAAYNEYLAEYPETARFRETARWEIAQLENKPVVFLEYLEDFPETKLAVKEGTDRGAIERKIVEQVENLTDTVELKIIGSMLDVIQDGELRDKIQKILELKTRKTSDFDFTLKNNGLDQNKSPSTQVKIDQSNQIIQQEKGFPEKKVEKPSGENKETEKPAVLPEKTTTLEKDKKTTFFKKAYGQVMDKEGNVYRTLNLNNQIWLADNLNIEVPDSWCYKMSKANCQKYGRLFTLEAAIAGCKLLGENWRVPTDQEWKNMTNLFGGVYSNRFNNGTIAYRVLIKNGLSGFDALLGGERTANGEFVLLGRSGGYWSSTRFGKGEAWYYWFPPGDPILGRDLNPVSWAFSVRCIKD